MKAGGLRFSTAVWRRRHEYAVAKATIEARRKGHAVTERRPDGSIKLTIQVAGGVA